MKSKLLITLLYAYYLLLFISLFSCNESNLSNNNSMNMTTENKIFQYQFTPKSASKDRKKMHFFLDTKATLFVSTNDGHTFQHVQELDSVFLYDVKEYINNILGSDWEQQYKGSLKKGEFEFTENFTFNNGTKQISIQVENGNRPRILEDFLIFLKHFYPSLSTKLTLPSNSSFLE